PRCVGYGAAVAGPNRDFRLDVGGVAGEMEVLPAWAQAVELLAQLELHTLVLGRLGIHIAACAVGARLDYRLNGRVEGLQEETDRECIHLTKIPLPAQVIVLDAGCLQIRVADHFVTCEGVGEGGWRQFAEVRSRSGFAVTESELVIAGNVSRGDAWQQITGPEVRCDGIGRA